MAIHVWTVFCERGVIDKITNNVSLQHVIEQLTLPAGQYGPGQILCQFHIVALWARSALGVPEQPGGRARYLFRSPDGADSNPIERELPLQEYERVRHVMRLNAIPFTVPGGYWIITQMKPKKKKKGVAARWRTVSKVPFQVAIAPGDEADGEPGQPEVPLP